MEIRKVKIEMDEWDVKEIIDFQQYIQRANRSGGRKSSIDKSGDGVAVMNWDDNCFLDDVSDLSDMLCNLGLWEEEFREVVNVVGGDYMAWGLIMDKYLTIDKIEKNPENEDYPYWVTFSLDTEALKKDYGIDVVMLEADQSF